MSPMWLTSNTPTAPRTPLCSATSPPPDGYSTGISQPPKLTILAPNRRCSALRGVLRSSLILGEFAASIPHARANLGRKPILTRDQHAVKNASKEAIEILLSRRHFFAISPTWILRILPAELGLPLCAPVRYILFGGKSCPGRSFAASAIRPSTTARVRNTAQFAKGRTKCASAPTVYTIAPIAGRRAT